MKNSKLIRYLVSTRRYLLSSGTLVILAAAVVAIMAATTAAQAANLDLREGDIPLGAEDAPVTIIEYASMTCPHCATFHRETMPKLKSEYIDTGKVRFIFREFPLDGLALKASMVARCAGPQKFYGFLDMLFKQQNTWGRAKDPQAALGRIARFGGMAPATFDKCMANRDLSREIVASRLYGDKEMGVKATPTLFVNDEVISGAPSFEALDKMLKDMIGG